MSWSFISLVILLSVDFYFKMAGKGTRYQDSLLSVSKVPIYTKQNPSSNSENVADSMEQSYFEEWPSTKGKEAKGLSGKSSIVIHVCDEAKNVKQDFVCQKELLINEMKYFADYLSNETDKWEDVDISVHCDVYIFDWLMRYVKQESVSVEDKPKLEPSNVISILISSEFLKMEKLVQECILYCYRNISKIIATPCNMNCINDKLVARIAKLFTHKEVEAIADKKDKFKSKLFCKKFEELFSPDFGNEDCPSNASTMFRCIYCEKLLTAKFHSKIECTPDRTIIDNRGNLSYGHSRDEDWDINDYLLNLKGLLKTWRNVYWRIWGTINYLHCSRCQETFPCTDFGACAFHPQQPVYSSNSGSLDKTTASAGYMPCCKATAIKFNPIEKSKGCTFREHLVEVCSSGRDVSATDGAGYAKINHNLNSKAVYDQLLAHKDVVCVPPKQSKFKNENIFITSILSPASMAPPHAAASLANSKHMEAKQSLRFEMKSRRVARNRVKNYEDEDDSDSEENGIVRVVINPTKRNPRAEDKPCPTWDTSLPTRLNQDLQREDDLRRMNELMMSLVKRRFDETQKTDSDKALENTQEAATPGTYHRIEQQFRAMILSSRTQNPNSSSSSYGSRPGRVSSVK
ncbi:SANT and BTB domain regulator of class switch recombination-like isoform X2 [Rhopilema esculentum]|uniref:SANT and BTB domain regulator of class switch recombination-like isoform X2 n=1 Tax=Rhopilema esculentum TaxID=499914 RepID=UPI0031DB0194